MPLSLRQMLPMIAVQGYCKKNQIIGNVVPLCLIMLSYHRAFYIGLLLLLDIRRDTEATQVDRKIEL